MAARCLFKSSMTHTKATSPFLMYSRASTILPCPSFFSPTRGTDFSLAHGSCILLLFLGTSSAPSTVAPPDSLLPDTCGLSSSSCFRFNMDFVITRSFSNSGKKYICFLLAHSVHTTPGGACVNTVPSTTSCFHFLTRASSTKQVALWDTHFFASRVARPLNQHPLPLLLFSRRCCPVINIYGIVRDVVPIFFGMGIHLVFFQRPRDAWLPPMLSVPPPELDTLPLPTPPLPTPSVPPPPATSGPVPIEAPPASSSAP